MGWLEPLDRKLYDKPHQCNLPRPGVSDEILPGARWQCDECQRIWIWSWREDYSPHFVWISPPMGEGS